MTIDEYSGGVSAGVQPVATPAIVAPTAAGPGAAAKRALDILGALTLLLLAAAPMILIAIAIRVGPRGPVFFRQLRVGRAGRLFVSYKFRSMYEDAEERMKEVAHLNEIEGPTFKIREDPRMTRVGRLIRRTSLDELPQLLNVLRGEMSLVGPRPGLMSEVLHYEPWQLERLTVKPGLTGLWQVSGRSELPFDEMIRLDLEYIRRRSFWFDVGLLLRTLPAVLSGRGAY